MKNLTDIPTEITHNGTTHVKRLVMPNEPRAGSIATMNYAWLDPQSQLTPHTHPDGEEYYFFLDGIGEMQIGETWIPVQKGFFTIIPIATIHSVKNTGTTALTFITIRTIAV